MTVAGSLILYLIAKNIALGHMDKYAIPDEEARYYGGSWMGEKEAKNAARIIVNGCSQYRVAEQVAKEWEMFPAMVRMWITEFANTGWRSGNVTKGLIRADKLLGGKILSRPEAVTVSELETVGGRLMRVKRRVNPAAAGAAQAFGGFRRPAHYEKMSPAEKRKFAQQMAKERREQKKR